MSATITTLPPRSKLGGEEADHQHQDADAVQPVEGISQRDSFMPKRPSSWIGFRKPTGCYWVTSASLSSRSRPYRRPVPRRTAGTVSIKQKTFGRKQAGRSGAPLS